LDQFDFVCHKFFFFFFFFFCWATSPVFFFFSFFFFSPSPTTCSAEIVDTVVPANIASLNCAARAHFELPPKSSSESATPFGRAEVEKPPPGKPRAEHTVSYRREWKVPGRWDAALGSAGGCINERTWSRNPQICVMAKPGTWKAEDKSRIDISLRQSPKAGDAVFDKECPMGVYIFRHTERQSRKFGSIGQADLVAKAEFAFQKLVTLEAELPHPGTGSFLIVPCMFKAGVEADFELEVVCRDRELFVQPLDHYHEESFELEWGAHTAGGCASFQTWRSNPQVQFYPTVRPTRVVVELRQHVDREAGEKPNPIGIVVCMGSGLDRVLTHAVPGNTVAKSKFAPMPMNTVTATVSEAEQYVVVPSTFEGGAHGKFTVTVFSDSPVVASVVPQPWPWRETYIDGEWTEQSAGGSPDDEIQYRRNPRFLLTPHSSLLDRPLLSMITITQPEAAPLNEIGFVLYRLGWMEVSEEPEWTLDADYALFRSQVAAEQQVLTEVRLLEGPEEFEQFVIVPITKTAGKTGKFTIRVMYNAPVQCTLRAAPQWQHTRLSGEWLGDSAGGSANHTSWVRNPHFHIARPDKETVVHIFLRQDGAEKDTPVANLLNIGMYVLVKKGKAASAVAKIPFSPIRENTIMAVLDPAKHEQGFWLAPATFEPKREGKFTIDVYANHPLAIDPAPTDGVVAAPEPAAE
jgi:hypothetical protein